VIPVARSAILVQACLNGSRRRNEHVAVPVSPQELADAARRAVAAGAAELHVHPRLPGGADTLAAVPCAKTIEEIREVCPGVPVGLTTGAWIDPDPRHRLLQISQWEVKPDYVSVNFSEPGALGICEWLIRNGIGVEAGLVTTAETGVFIKSGVAERCLRVLVEVGEYDPSAAVQTAAAIDAMLDEDGITVRRLHHGVGMATWAVLAAALDRGWDIRVGLEDTLHLPDGRRAQTNTELVAAAVDLVRRHGRMLAS
jgi:uncharacterized protein (DUF849 family)